jgi:hypothetical protein
MMSSADTSDIYKHPKGLFPRLMTLNYAAWKGNMRRMLRAILAWTIIDGTKSIPPLAAPGATPAERAAAELQWTNYIQCREDAAAMIYNACSIGVSVYIDDIDDPEDMWLTLGERCNTGSTAVGRQALYQQFMSMKPIPGAPIGDDFSSLLEIHNQIVGSSEAISDIAFRTHIFSCLPPVYEVTGKILQNRADATIEEIIDALKEDERICAMQTQPAATTNVYYSSSSNRGSGQHRGRGRGTGRGGSHNNKENRWCTHCQSSMHNTEKCYYKPESSNKRHRETSEDDTCYYCGESGYKSPSCPIRRRGEATREQTKCTRTSSGSANFTSAGKEASNSTGY